MKGFITILCAAAGILLACTKKQSGTESMMPTIPDTKQQTMPASTDTLTYLALGDSYTIGEAVPADQSFPYQLAALLKQKGHPTAQPVIIARTGWTTGELISAIGTPDNKKYSFVTLLIGVNNQYRGYPQDQYRTEFIQLLKTAINFAGGNAKHVFVVSIPDYSVTPYAASSDKVKISSEIDQFNNINFGETQKLGANYCGITNISRGAADNPKLIAHDGLHPSGDMYALWAAALEPQVADAFKQ